ncbi:MAG TPA: hypothetical protein VIG37_23970 [Methylomirabilota bacterium]
MTSLAMESFGAPSSRREARVLGYLEDWAVDELSTRTLWCASGLSRGQRSARAMEGRLRRPAEQELGSRELNVTASDALLELTQCLDTMLHGEGAAPGRLGADDREVCDEATANSDVLVGETVRADDLVVLHDPLAVIVAQAIRERGAHVVWYLDVAPGPARVVTTARHFLQEYAEAVHAYVTARRRPSNVRGQRIAAFIPSVDVLAVRDIDEVPSAESGRRGRLAWASTLAEVTRVDRAETVGGTVHARPAVAAR